MHLSSSSAAGVRFLTSVGEGRGLKRSAREAGVGKETGYRWLREAYVAHRRSGKSIAETEAVIGLASAKSIAWEAEVAAGPGRHHLRVAVEAEARFWAVYDSGTGADAAASAAGVGRSTAYRWLDRRFCELRAAGFTVKRAQRLLSLTDQVTARAERRRAAAKLAERQAAAAAHEDAQRSSRQYADRTIGELSKKQQQRAELVDTYWQLMRSGETNASACRVLGMSRRSGTTIRRAHHYHTRARVPRVVWSGRYLDVRERLQIADLLRLGFSLRRIAAELGRHPSTIKRELDRHRSPEGRYLPRTADHDARQQRARPRASKLTANITLRRLVQRKLNRCWSPDEICGWLRKTYPDDLSMRLCPETIYRELLLRDNTTLHKKYCLKLRTGRRIRKSRWLTRTGHGPTIANKTMISQRPASAETKLEAGHWEGDLIIGVGSASAMVTLRERKTQYGVIVNLPHDHTAASVNAAVAGAFTAMPAHMKRTLTWDQGVEMAKHQDLTAATGVQIYFAERSSPWQRGANENYNGLVRQYFPKGTNLAVHSHAHVAYVTAELNNRPRKGLGYDTPAFRFATETAAINTPLR
jgi:IS30 family transposase